jgi:photosystem II stability/assembly factor-like uncharacterized protein
MLLAPRATYAQWEHLLRAEGISSVDFIDHNNGWVYQSEFGYLWKTSDAGKNWSLINDRRIERMGLIGEIKFITLNTGFAIDVSIVKRTTNLGKTWSTVLTSVDNCSIVDSTYIFAIATYGGIKCQLLSTNAGDSWVVQDSSKVELDWIEMTSRINGVGIRNDGSTYYTRDGGWTWKRSVDSSVLQGVTHVKSIPTGLVVAVTDSLTLHISTNNGDSWSTVSRLKADYVLDRALQLRVTKDSAIFVLLRGKGYQPNRLIRSTDLGKSFSLHARPDPDSPYTIDALSRSEFYLCENWQGLFRTNGARPSRIKLNTKQSALEICRKNSISMRVMAVDGYSPISYKWTYLNGDQIVAPVLPTGSSGTDKSFLSVVPIKDTTLRLIATDSLGYSDTAYYSIRVADRPIFRVTAPKQVCGGGTVRLSYQLYGGSGIFYSITASNGVVSSNNNASFDITASDSVSMYVQMRFTDKDSICFADTALYISVLKRPTISVREQPVGVLDALYDFPTSRADFQWYSVVDSTWTPIQFENKAQFYPTKQGRYGVEVTDASTGCSQRSPIIAFGTVSAGHNQPLDNCMIMSRHNSGQHSITWTSPLPSSITFHTLRGEQVGVIENRDSSGTVDVASLSLTPGLYIASIRDARCTSSVLMLVE